jgi:hypothetical protein
MLSAILKLAMRTSRQFRTSTGIPCGPDRGERQVGRAGFGRHRARRIRDGLRVDPLFEPNRKVLGLVINRALRRVLEVDAEDESVLLFEPP